MIAPAALQSKGSIGSNGIPGSLGGLDNNSISEGMNHGVDISMHSK
jgi:hypothetical protein